MLPARVFFTGIGAVYLAAAGMAFASGELPRGPVPTAQAPKTNPLDPFLRGVREILRSPDLSFLVTLAAIRAAFIGGQTTLFIVYVKSALGLGNAEYGWLLTAVGVGSVAGSFVGSLFWKPERGRWGLLPGVCVHLACFAGLGFIRSLWGALMLTGVSFTIFYATLVSLHSLRDRAAPGDARGEVYGTVTAVLTLPTIVSMLAGSALIGAVGIKAALLIIGTGGAALPALSILVPGNRETALRKAARRKAAALGA